MSLLVDRIIRDFGTPVNVNTLTVLFPFETFGERLAALSVYCVNIDPTNAVTFTLEGSETGTNTDPDKTFVKVADPGKQISFDLEGSNMLVTHWRLSAFTESPGFPTAQVRYRVKGQVQKG